MTKKAIDKVSEDEFYEDNTAEILEKLAPIADKIVELINKHNEVRGPLIRRWQNINFLIMALILVIVGGLAYVQVIDGSAVTGLIGAIIGYVFGGLYQQKRE